MSRKATCLDNAVAENFFGLLKTELFYLEKFDSVDQLEKAIVEYIDYYNNRRIKLKLNGLSPVQYRIDCIIVPRKEADGKAISASTVRQCLQSDDWDTLKTLLPQTSLAYFRSPEAAAVLERIRKAGNVVHY